MTKEEFEKHYMVVGEHVHSAGLFQLEDHSSNPMLGNELMGEEDFDTDYYAIIETDDDGLYKETIDDSFRSSTEAWEAYDKLMAKKTKDLPTKPYALTLLLDAGRLPREVVDQVEEKVVSLKGKVVKGEDGGIKTLAYPIGRAERAQYYYLDLELPDNTQTELSHWLETNEDILRYLLVRTDPRYAKKTNNDNNN